MDAKRGAGLTILEGLDGEQERAVTLETNGVAEAGAGSGKTKVLASRYVWLVTEKNLAPGEILTLTFTNKAVSEMYSRIYRYLLEEAEKGQAGGSSGGEKAAAALAEFHKARIGTLDSFSAGVARTAAARYGISPDFRNDDAALRDLAREAALLFVLDNREAPAMRRLLVDHKIRELGEEIFGAVVLRYSPVSSPLDFGRFLSAQRDELRRAWRETGGEIEGLSRAIQDELSVLRAEEKSIAFTETLGEIFSAEPPPPLPDIGALFEGDGALSASGKNAEETAGALRDYFAYYAKIISARTPGRYGEAFENLVDCFRRLKGKNKDGLYHKLESVANCALNFDLLSGAFHLLEKFQDEFNAKKRQTGFLSFNDIARLAVDALRDHPDIRKMYKDSLKMIMIDEFQDNNALQRDLIYLLAEKAERMAKGVAARDELEKNRMFFVGDEKQSIYRFRGADVAVFRGLGKDLAGKEGGAAGSVYLSHNYRSRPGLVAVFNRIFGGLDESGEGERGGAVFLPPGPGVPDYEAVYSRVFPPEHPGEAEKGPLAHFCFLDERRLPEDDDEGIKSYDLEAAFIAEKIRGMVTRKEKIPKRGNNGIEWVECSWGDFAVLQRSYTHQSSLEKYFREFGVLYNTDRPSGLFNDAPLLDLLAFLRLIIYPEDRIAYAALIRSPFTRLGDLSLAVCMLNKDAEPFSEENDPLIPEDDIALYRRARERYRRLRDASRNLSITEILIKLWFEEGYRYETIWSEQAQVYESLFDLFFSLASEADSRGRSLPDFIKYVDDVMRREEKPDDRDIPGEGESGVRITSIHKSKGLEFPVVFIYNCAGKPAPASSDLVILHEKYGPVLDVPRAEELSFGGNYFRDIIREEERAKNIAELRRLLYVAMTRAEAALFLTFTLPKQTKKEKDSWDMGDDDFTEETLRLRLSQFDEKSEDNPDNFLKLLAGILPGCSSRLCALETIPVLTRADIKRRAASASLTAAGVKTENPRSQREAALAAEAFYEKARLVPAGEAAPGSVDASKLTYAPPGREAGDGLPKKSGGNGGAPTPADIDPAALEPADINPAEFGTLVHAVLEGRLNGRPLIVPKGIRSRISEGKALQKLLAEAEILADGFLASELGKRWAASNARESEFPVITSVTVRGKAVAVTGKIDLLFEEDDETVVVDFKTDRAENPEVHYAQLAAYARAAADIFGKPVSTWIFYLRSGRAVNVTEDVRRLSLEEAVEAALLRLF